MAGGTVTCVEYVAAAQRIARGIQHRIIVVGEGRTRRGDHPGADHSAKQDEPRQDQASNIAFHFVELDRRSV